VLGLRLPRQSNDSRVKLRSTMSRLAVRIFRISLVSILSLWIAGAGCMFGCQNMIAAASTSSNASAGEHGLAAIVSGEACASNDSHDCCAQKKTAAKAKTQNANTRVSLKLATLLSQSESLKPSPSSGMRECPLALSRAVAITKATDSKQFADSIATALTRPVVADSPEQHIALSPLARLPNRGHTYLRCCVFLI
jgi:hypothetical protein